jgi:hypothetical protein
VATIPTLDEVLDDTPEAPPRPLDLESTQAPESMATPMTGLIETTPRSPLEPSEGAPLVLPPRPAHETGSGDVRTLRSPVSGTVLRQCAVCHAPLAGRTHRQTCSAACRRARSRLREDSRLQRQVRELRMEVLRLKMQELDGRFGKLEAEVRARRGAGRTLAVQWLT